MTMCLEVYYRYPRVFGLGGGHRPQASLTPLPAGFSTEEYDEVCANAFLDPTRHPLSTFSIDVDTASMSNVRRILRDGSLPTKGAVRIEEMLNYFSYDYPDPAEGRPIPARFPVAGPCGRAAPGPPGTLRVSDDYRGAAAPGIASRLEAACEPGRILISDATYQQVKDEIDVEDYLKEFALD